MVQWSRIQNNAGFPCIRRRRLHHFQWKSTDWSAVNFIKTLFLEEFQPEPAIWSCGTGQRRPWFDSCQLTMKWISDIKLHRCMQGISLPVWAPCCATSSSSSSSSCVRTRPRAIYRRRRWPYENECTGFIGMELRMAAFGRRCSAINK